MKYLFLAIGLAFFFAEIRLVIKVFEWLGQRLQMLAEQLWDKLTHREG